MLSIEISFPGWILYATLVAILVSMVLSKIGKIHRSAKLRIEALSQ